MIWRYLQRAPTVKYTALSQKVCTCDPEIEKSLANFLQQKQICGTYSHKPAAIKPVSALPFVVVHELSHLRHRNHADGFRAVLSCVILG
ncbi:M48 family metallopeptidase [Nostoc sp. LEGE 12450]|nr:M48 family metallopeptidase [Nostoc sp. LEGE 12450]